MAAKEVHIREQALPGVGRRFDLDVEDGLTLIVIARRDGSRDVAVTEGGVDQPRRSVHLGRERAVAVGSLLLGARFSEGDHDSAGALDVGTVVVGPRSPAIGRIPSEIDLPGGREAAVVAVARDDTPQLLEDDRSRPCEVGDRLVIVSRRDGLEAVLQHLSG